jgi:hypothetical protein
MMKMCRNITREKEKYEEEEEGRKRMHTHQRAPTTTIIEYHVSSLTKTHSACIDAKSHFYNDHQMNISKTYNTGTNIILGR